MPELSKDAFGDSLAREIFLLGKSPLDHDHVDHHSLQDQRNFFSGSRYSFEDMFKPPQQEKQKILPGMSTISPLSLSQPDAFVRHASTFLPLEIDTCQGQRLQHEQKHEQNHHYPHKQQQTVNSFFRGSGLLHEQSLQLEVPEIEDCNTSWMSDVLNDFPAINTEAELPPLVSPSTNASFDGIPPSRDFPSTPGRACQTPMSQQPQYTALQLSLDRSRIACPPESKSTIPPINSVRTCNQGVRIPKARGPPGRDVSYNLLKSSSTTPKPFNPRGSVTRRYQRVSDKSKEVSHMEKLDHVRRERQRRNDMSFKISTLECLLPPLGPNLKRDRAAIVHDSVQYLKSLQERVEELRETLAEMKLKSSTSGAARQTAVVKKENPELPTCSDGKSRLVEYYVQVEGDGEAPLRLEKCRCRSDFMSSAMKILEHFNLEVCRCAVTKMFDYTICVFIAKPRSTASNQVASSASVVSAFRSSLQLS